MSNPITANITIEQYNHGHVDIKCVITNNSGDDYDLLSWHTPLNGRAEFWNMMKVTLKGDDGKNEVIPYDGLHVKRGKPTIDDYFILKAGKSTEQLSFSLTESYKIEKIGNYDIVLDTIILDAAKTSSNSVPRPHNQYHSLSLTSNTVTIELDEKSPPTIAENYRRDQKLVNQATVVPPASGTHSKLQPATFTAQSSNAARQKLVIAAHRAGYVWAKAAAMALSNDSHFTRWFGTFDKSKQKTLISYYIQIVKQMESKSVIYDFDDTLTHIAQVVGNGKTWDGIVKLGQQFWELESLGLDSQAGTVIHELSHVVYITSDLIKYWYSAKRSEHLADISSEYCIMHADSVEYYAETTFPFKGLWVQGSQVIKIGNGEPIDYAATIDKVGTTTKNLSSKNKMQFSAKEGQFQMVVSDGPDTVVGKLSDDLRIINWDKKWGTPSLEVVAEATHYGAIEVSGAGTEEANGVYLPIRRSDLPKDAPVYGSRLIWRHTKWRDTKHDNLVIRYIWGCWWIGYYKENNRDLYWTDYNNDNYSLVPPINLNWEPINPDEIEGKIILGVAPAPTVTFGLMWTLIDLPKINEVHPEFGGYLLEISDDGRSGLVVETQDQGVANFDDAKTLISNSSKHSEIGKKFQDWRLPTAAELNNIRKMRASIGGFSDIYYLSESKTGAGVWGIDFKNGEESDNGVDANNSVRTVRDVNFLNPKKHKYTIDNRPELGGYVLREPLPASGITGLVVETQDQGKANWENAKASIKDPSKHSKNGSKFDDWRLPTKDELLLIWTHLADSDGNNWNPGPDDPNNIGNFQADAYWSSEQYGNDHAWYLYSDTGGFDMADKTASLIFRAVRTF